MKINYTPPHATQTNFVLRESYTPLSGDGGLLLMNGGTLANGLGWIAGTVKIDGAVVPNAVLRLFLERTREYVGSTLSDSEGKFRFNNINQDELFYITAVDPDGDYEYRVSSRRKPQVGDYEFWGISNNKLIVDSVGLSELEPFQFTQMVDMLIPFDWFRLNDNDANSIIINEVDNSRNGSFVVADEGVSIGATANTNINSTTGLVASDLDKALLTENRIIEVPAVTVANFAQWSVFFKVKIDSMKVVNGYHSFFQFGDLGNGCPEIASVEVDADATFRFRFMKSGQTELATPTQPFFPMKETLAVCVTYSSNVVNLYVNGELELTFTANNWTPHSGVYRWCGARFGSNTSYYTADCVYDELILFDYKLSESEAIILTSY